jgi:hypothetical protein
VIEEDDVPLSELKEILHRVKIGVDDNEIEQWVEQKEERIENYEMLTDQEIIESITKTDESDDVDDEENIVVAPNMLSNSETIEILEKIIYFTEAQEWCNSLELSVLNSLLRKTSLHRQHNFRQIRAFLKK